MWESAPVRRSSGRACASARVVLGMCGRPMRKAFLASGVPMAIRGINTQVERLDDVVGDRRSMPERLFLAGTRPVVLPVIRW